MMCAVPTDIRCSMFNAVQMRWNFSETNAVEGPESSWRELRSVERMTCVWSQILDSPAAMRSNNNNLKISSCSLCSSCQSHEHFGGIKLENSNKFSAKIIHLVIIGKWHSIWKWLNYYFWQSRTIQAWIQF